MKIKVKVVPRAKREAIEPFEDGFKIYLKELALEGRANKKLIEILADFLGTKKYNLQIVKGLKSRDKLVEISEINR
ncbi:MAG: DUF167 domain-containing protein [Candidatus Omnitrophota bacterium]|nr:DUF167 domain-containing protein [Candidatus Omnitrophota bacterium]